MSEKLLTLAEAATLLGVSKMTMRRWTDSGDFPCIRIGKRRDRRFRKQDIEKYLQQNLSVTEIKNEQKLIMVVEDERIVACDLEILLQTFGYQVVLAHTGREACRKATDYHPDLILMDIMLNDDMDGIEAMEMIQKNQDIPVIYLSAYTDEAHIERAKHTFPAGYIVKPYKKEEIRVNVMMALYQHQRKMV